MQISPGDGSGGPACRTRSKDVSRYHTTGDLILVANLVTLTRRASNAKQRAHAHKELECGNIFVDLCIISSYDVESSI